MAVQDKVTPAACLFVSGRREVTVRMYIGSGCERADVLQGQVIHSGSGHRKIGAGNESFEIILKPNSIAVPDYCYIVGEVFSLGVCVFGILCENDDFVLFI